jgi:glycerol 2-dehydrogenase (NADP+)
VLCPLSDSVIKSHVPPGSPLLGDPEVGAIAENYKVSPATILISYQVNRGCIVLPKSVTPERITSNLKVIVISKEDMDVLESTAAKGKQQRVNTPNWGHDLVSTEGLVSCCADA